MAAPEEGPALAVRVCEHFNFNSDCATQFGILSLGSVITQVVANADVGGLDGQVRYLLTLATSAMLTDDAIYWTEISSR